MDKLTQEKLPFYGKNDDLKKRVNFDHIFGDKKARDDDDHKMKQLMASDVIKDANVNLGDLIASKNNFLELKKRANGIP